MAVKRKTADIANKIIQYQYDGNWFTSLLSSSDWHEAVVQSPNSNNDTNRIAYVKEHKYCAHRKNCGIKLIWIKNPENNNWGTICVHTNDMNNQSKIISQV